MRNSIISAALAIAAAFVATSCAQEMVPAKSGIFVGILDQFGDVTKTALTSTHGVEWESTDLVRINDGIYNVTPQSPATKATFTFSSGTEPTSGTYYAYYPSTIFDGTKATLPETQTYAADKITNNPMYATSETKSLSFHNLCGLVEFTLKGDETVKRIDINAASGGLSGEFTVSGNAAVLTDAAKTANKGVILDCGSGVALNNADGVKFRIAIPAGTYSLTFTFYDTTGKMFHKVTKNDAKVAANTIYAFTEAPFFDEPDYLCFEALEAPVALETYKLNSYNANALEYLTQSASGTYGEWTTVEYNASLPTLANVGDKIYFRAKEKRTVAQTTDNHIEFACSGGKMKASGDILYLVDPSGFASLQGYDFECLFRYCSTLVDASKLKLSSNVLAQDCYYGMFLGCTMLTAAPETLPAEALAANCYESMFSGCTALTSAPALLPAMELQEKCYADMFYGCTSLTTTPVLPAKNLATKCYNEMFKGCTSLTTVSTLPATTLAVDCYYEMFNGCSSLETCPALPATELPEGCYDLMFSNCTSLKTAPDLPATKIGTRSYGRMFKGCTSLTTATSFNATELATNCCPEMFSGCTSLTAAPAILPATTLKSSCYYQMFYGCTALTKAPVLPARTIASTSYREMFQGCSKLNEIVCFATNIATGSPTVNSYFWVNGVSSNGKIIVAKGYKDDWYGNVSNKKPENFTVVEAIPGTFSVSATKRVSFSIGNLWSKPSSNQWNFETNQYDYTPKVEGAYSTDHVCLFYWETTGNYGGNNLCTTKTGTTSDVVDWGVPYCTTHSVPDGTWRTLTSNEWKYLLSDRGTGKTFFKPGVTVNGVANCLIIAPDGNTVDIATSYDDTAWKAAEALGFVCLPPAGFRGKDSMSENVYVYNVGTNGYYCSSTAYSTTESATMSFNSSVDPPTVTPQNFGPRESGYSVRLITDID